MLASRPTITTIAPPTMRMMKIVNPDKLVAVLNKYLFACHVYNKSEIAVPKIRRIVRIASASTTLIPHPESVALVRSEIEPRGAAKSKVWK